MKMTTESLIQAGYRCYIKPKYSHDHADAFFQKRFDDAHGKMFFVDVYTYSIHLEGVTQYSASFNVQYTLQDGESVNMEYLYNKNKTIEEIESFFLRVFENNANIRHYELWGE